MSFNPLSADIAIPLAVFGTSSVISKSSTAVSAVAFPAASVTVATVWYLPSANTPNVPALGVAVSRLIDHIPPVTDTLLYVAPLIVTDNVSPVPNVTEPVITGVVSFVTNLSTTAAVGAAVSSV